MKKIVVLVCLFLLLTVPAFAELDVIATNFPLYDFARQVAGEAAQVRMLISPGTEVHAYDPTPKDMIAVQECDMLLYVGGDSEGWVDTLLSAVSDGPQTLRLMECVEGIEDHSDHDHASDEHSHHDEAHDHGVIAFDEHIWTSPVNAMAMVRMICDGLCAADPDNAALYQQNAAAYIAEIAALDEQFRALVDSAENRVLVFADRFPLAYFAQEYGIEVIAAVNGCSAESEPSANQMQMIIDTVRAQQISCVYTIEMSTGRVAETVRAETGCDVLCVHSCQNVTKDEMNAGETYVSLMQKNLAALEVGLN